MEFIDSCDMCGVFDTAHCINLEGIIFYVCRRCERDYEAAEPPEVSCNDIGDRDDLCLR
jgi:ribosome-binding protein aMBF1 (putative translation factor)